MLTISGFGHSHIAAVAKGAYELSKDGALLAGRAFRAHFSQLYDPDLTPTFAGGEERLSSLVVDRIESQNPDVVLLSVGGNEHNVLSVARPSEPYDFVLGENPELPLDPGAMALPEAAVREMVREKLDVALAIIRAFRDATRRPLVCLEPPPPHPTEHVLAHPNEFFKAAVDGDMISPEPFRHKIWRVQALLYRELCERLDIVYAPSPAEFTNEAGLLDRDAWGGDATHANALYGKRAFAAAATLVLDRVFPSGPL